MNMSETRLVILNNNYYMKPIEQDTLSEKLQALSKNMIDSINESTYVSLYEYLGESTKGSDIARLVTATAVKFGIKIKHRLLPEQRRTSDFSSVQIYPIEFLDIVFERTSETNNIATKYDLKVLDQRILELERRVIYLESCMSKVEFNKQENSLTTSTRKIDDYDDLPF